MELQLLQVNRRFCGCYSKIFKRYTGKKIIEVLQVERYDTGNKVWDTGRLLFIEVKLRFI